MQQVFWVILGAILWWLLSMAISVWRKAKTLANQAEAMETLSRYGLTPTVYQFNDGGDDKLARAVRLFDGFLFVNRDGVVIGNLVPTDEKKSKAESEVSFEDEPQKHRPNLRLVQSKTQGISS